MSRTVAATTPDERAPMPLSEAPGTRPVNVPADSGTFGSIVDRRSDP